MNSFIYAGIMAAILLSSVFFYTYIIPVKIAWNRLLIKKKR